MKKEEVWLHGQHKHFWLHAVPMLMYARALVNHFPPEPELLDHPPEFFQEHELLDQRPVPESFQEHELLDHPPESFQEHELLDQRAPP